MKTAQIRSWVNDKAARAGDHSHRRMLSAAGDRLGDYIEAVEHIRQLREEAKGLRKSVLEEVLELLEGVDA